MVGLAMIAFLTFACVFGSYLLPHDHLFIDLRARRAPPMSGTHWPGADPLGRDIAARALVAGSISLSQSAWRARRTRA